VDNKRFLIDDWLVSPAEGTLSQGDVIIRLEPKVMEVLSYFASRPREVITREELERDVWHGALVGYDSVTATIIKLRKALQDNPRQPRLIATIPKRGYQLITEVDYPGEDFVANTTQPSQARQQRFYLNKVALIGLTVALLAGVGWFVMLTPPDIKPPSVLVLPIVNMESDPKHDVFMDGITEDIITDLSRLSGLTVFSSSTSFSFRNKQVSPEALREKHAVDYVLKGSVRRLKQSLRVNMELIDTETNLNAWAQRYERGIDDVFAIQDDIANSLIDALAIKLTSYEQKRLAKRETNNLRAYDIFLEGQRVMRFRTRQSNEQAKTLYREAIEIDPTYGRAFGALAFSLIIDYRRGWTDAPQETLDRALALAEQAVTLDNSVPQTHWMLGFVRLIRKEHASAEHAITEAVRIAPNYADAYALLGLITLNQGKPREALEHLARGRQLNPYYTWEYLHNTGRAHYVLGDYAKAIDWLERAKERNENVIFIKMYLAASYLRDNRQDDAEWVVEDLLTTNPELTLTHIENTYPLADREGMKILIDDLKRAGLPK